MSTAMTNREIKIWDMPVRVFHWSLATSFLVAYLTEDDFMTPHTYAGYVVGGLVLFRLLWGFVGTPHARFHDFVRSPAQVVDYLKQIIGFRARRYLGHNPAGGAMVIALLLSLVLTVISGVATYGAEQASGPLAGLMATLPLAVGKAAEEVHEFFANFTLLLIILHLVGVLLATLQHRENLVRAMFTGRKAPQAGE